jgi:hypothetical protein
MKWVTRAKANVDRIACPWLIKRFVDPDAEFLFVPAAEVMATAARRHHVGVGRVSAIAHGFALALYAWCQNRVASAR